MKKKVLLSLLFLLTLFTLTSCDKNNSTIKTKLSCSKEFTLFHSKQYIKHTVFLDKNNQLLNYEKIEKYYSFDSDDDFNMICDGAPQEAELNNKYEYLNEVANCNKKAKEVVITDEYAISKIPSKNILPSKDVITYLTDDYILDLENYKNDVINKGYTCE